MFCDDALGVLNGHQIPGKGTQFGASCLVKRTKRKLFQVVHSGLPANDRGRPGTAVAHSREHCDAPSVLVPEIVIPSAGAQGATLQSFEVLKVRLPESLPGRLLLRHRLCASFSLKNRLRLSKFSGDCRRHFSTISDIRRYRSVLGHLVTCASCDVMSNGLCTPPLSEIETVSKIETGLDSAC